MELRYYNGEVKNPFLKKNESAVRTWELLESNPRAYWWEFETTYGHKFSSPLEAVECYAYKYSDYAPFTPQQIVKSYKDNAINKL